MSLEPSALCRDASPYPRRQSSDASETIAAVDPIGFDASACRPAWTMPSFYLVPFMCAYLYAGMWIVRGCWSFRRVATRGRGVTPSRIGGW